MRDRAKLHEEAERIARALLERHRRSPLPEDVVTTLSYYLSCRGGVDRAAEHVLGLAALVGDGL